LLQSRKLTTKLLTGRATQSFYLLGRSTFIVTNPIEIRVPLSRPNNGAFKPFANNALPSFVIKYIDLLKW